MNQKQYPQFLPQTLCHTCAGCNRVENERFPGVTKCDNYIASYHEYYKSLNTDYGCAVENKYQKSEIETYRKKEERNEKDKIINDYWKGD